MKSFCILLGLVCLLGSCGQSDNNQTQENEHPETKDSVVTQQKAELHINKKVATCHESTRQSPINIQMPTIESKHQLEFDYKQSHEIVEHLRHTVELVYDKGSKITFDSVTYNLVQLHFHTPSEHHIAGKSFPMEAHLVHKAADSTFLVVSIIFTEGQKNSFIDAFISDIPANEGERNFNKQIDLRKLLPDEKVFYHYGGSLTTPPFTEGVKWCIFKTPVECSKTQIEKIAQMEGFNARDTQATNQREVDEF